MIEVCKHTLTGYYFSYLFKYYVICQQAYSSILGIQQVPLSVVCDPPSQKGASSWLNALPLKEHDFYLDKQTFWDTIHLRYWIELKGVYQQYVSVETTSTSNMH